MNDISYVNKAERQQEEKQNGIASGTSGSVAATRLEGLDQVEDPGEFELDEEGASEAEEPGAEGEENKIPPDAPKRKFGFF